MSVAPKRHERMAESDRELALTRRLVEELERQRVRYCHWKSTTTLARALAGGTDLDLLVDRRDATRFASASADLGFKRFLSHESRRFAGVEDLLGLDGESGRLVHLHVYYQLVLGEHYVKNHRLPLEEALLTETRLVAGVPVPEAELEAIVLALRTLLKYRDADALKDVLRLGRRGGIPPETRAELEDLAAQIDPDHLRDLLQTYLPEVPSNVILGLFDVVRRDHRDVRRLLALRAAARRSLRRYERLPRLHALLAYGRARISRQWPLRVMTGTAGRRQARRKSPQSGGVTVALVGADGAGKSSVVAALTEWLGWRVNLRTVYMGSAQPSRGTRAVKMTAKAVRSVARRTGGVNGAAAGLADALMALRYLGDGRDRQRRAVRGCRDASRGVVVIFDRYPLEGARVGPMAMDGPRIRHLPSARRFGALRALAALEERMYRAIPRPEHLIVLHVAPDVALSRKVHADPERVLAKIRAIDEMTLGRGQVVHVDANQSLDRVIREVKDAIWAVF